MRALRTELTTQLTFLTYDLSAEWKGNLDDVQRRSMGSVEALESQIEGVRREVAAIDVAGLANSIDAFRAASTARLSELDARTNAHANLGDKIAHLSEQLLARLEAIETSFHARLNKIEAQAAQQSTSDALAEFGARLAKIETAQAEAQAALMSRLAELDGLRFEAANQITHLDTSIQTRLNDLGAAQLDLTARSFELGNNLTHLGTSLETRLNALEGHLAENFNQLGLVQNAFAAHAETMEGREFEAANRLTHLDTSLSTALNEIVALQQDISQRMHKLEDSASESAEDLDVPEQRRGVRSIVRLKQIRQVEDKCYSAQLPKKFPRGDTADGAEPSRLMLLEDGRLLGPPHANHALIASEGRGQYSHWDDSIYFAASDGSDPRSNGRAYHVVLHPLELGAEWRRTVAAAFEGLSDDLDGPAAYAAVETALKAVYPQAIIGDYGKKFWREDSFIRDYERLVGDNFRSVERKFSVYNLMKLIDDVPGELAECGAYNGATAYFISLAAQQSSRARELHLFDSFEGLSAPTSLDGAFWFEHALSVTEEQARKNLEGHSGIHFYKGWIPSRFNEVADRSFALVHVDVDLYEPTKDSIEFFYARLAPGGLLICDDYGFDVCPGATKAMDEFFADKPERIVHLPTGQGLIVKRAR